MLIDLVAIGSWFLMLGGMLYGALHPEHLTAARRAMAADHPLTREDVKIVRAIAAVVVVISMWVWYVTGNTRLPTIFVSLSIVLCLGVDVVRKMGPGRLARRRLPIRLAGVGMLGMACLTWDDRDAFPKGIALVGATLILFPAIWSRLANGAMTEEREVVLTRRTGILGSIMAGLVIVALGYLTVRHHLSVR
jgi:hypothetical protein